jgi:tetratricopeptide (TPR) repeat protein
MGFFDFFKKNSSVVWKNKKGEIDCPGDSCPKNCDYSCPIWCLTKAIEMTNAKQYNQAISIYQKAILIEPKFKEAWVNLAVNYGMMNNHLEAQKAYYAAYNIDRKYKNAIFGLIISHKNLGRFDEALKFCDEYEVIVGKLEANKLRENIKNFQNSNPILKKQESAVEMSIKIIAQAKKLGILGQNDKYPNIPEIMALSKVTCKKIFSELIKIEDSKSNPLIWYSWAAFAGMGAVHFWNIDWDVLKNKGIAETLLEPRGVDEMDEFVVDAIGIGFETPEGKKFVENIYILTTLTIADFFNENDTIENVLELMSAMYLFGMVYQMERLGMK